MNRHSSLSDCTTAIFFLTGVFFGIFDFDCAAVGGLSACRPQNREGWAVPRFAFGVRRRRQASR